MKTYPRPIDLRRFPAFALALSIALALVAVVLPAAPASAATAFSPVADTYANGSSPTNNYGSRTSMRVDASPDRVAYLRFEVSGEGQPASALLRLYAASSNDGVSVHQVADNTWSESGLTYSNRPAVGAVVAASAGAVTGGTWLEFDVSSYVVGDGTYSFAVTTSDTTSLKLETREGSNPPELHVPAPALSTLYTIAGSGSSYTATSDTVPPAVLSGTLKTVVEGAAYDLEGHGGGSIIFGAGLYDLGNDHFEFDDVDGITFVGQGIDVTSIVNVTAEADDTEIFDFVHADHVVIRDMTLSAGGPERSTSDAIDFDDGRNSTVERVKIIASRGKGIVFDGKGVGWSATGNTVRDCIIENVPGDGIELLAASQNLIEGCVVSDTVGHGIQITKASSVASVPNKPADENIIRNNTVLRSGRDGINVNSGDDNVLVGNVITNSSQIASGRDAIRIESFDGASCDRTEVESNTLTDDQGTATQNYGLNIADPECTATAVGAFNTFAGNVRGDIKDLGTGTVYPSDTSAPSIPGNVSANPVSHEQVTVAWDASTDNVGVDGYGIYRDGSLLTEVGGGQISFDDTSVVPDTIYSYTVDAFDAAGNRSAQSSPPANATTPPPPSAFTVGAEADAYVNGADASTNYGSSTQLRVDGSPELRSYVRFAVSGTGGLNAALLRVRTDSNHPQGFEVWTVPDGTWDEATITYTTAPAIGSLVGVSGPAVAGQYAEIDVSTVVTGDGVYTLALVPISNTNLRMSSRESGAGPELAVEL